MSRMRRRLNVPTMLGVALSGAAACVFTGPLENGCGDNKPLCSSEIACYPAEHRDAGTDVTISEPDCPVCSNDQGECPAGCEPIPIFT